MYMKDDYRVLSSDGCFSDVARSIRISDKHSRSRQANIFNGVYRGLVGIRYSTEECGKFVIEFDLSKEWYRPNLSRRTKQYLTFWACGLQTMKLFVKYMDGSRCREFDLEQFRDGCRYNVPMSSLNKADLMRSICFAGRSPVNLEMSDMRISRFPFNELSPGDFGGRKIGRRITLFRGVLRSMQSIRQTRDGIIVVVADGDDLASCYEYFDHDTLERMIVLGSRPDDYGFLGYDISVLRDGAVALKDTIRNMSQCMNFSLSHEPIDDFIDKLSGRYHATQPGKS